jgi:hypothetical protein
MNSKILKIGIFTVSLLALSVVTIKSKSNGLSSAYSGAPSESTCTSCHSTYSVQTSGTNHDKISLKGNFTGGGYIPDSTYKITITYKETGKSVFGFQLTALQDQNASYPTPAGTFTSKDSRTSAFTQVIGSTTRGYIEHTSTGTNKVATDSVSWVFEWKAPSSNMGDIKMHLVLNVTNNNGNDAGDYIYTKKFVVSPSTLLPKAKAAISDTLYCSSKSLAFSGTSTNNATGYSWKFPGGSITSSTSQNPTVTYSTTGAKIAILESTNSKGKSQPDTLKFNVIQGATNPVVTPSTANASICTGDSMLFSVKQSTGHTYQWSPTGLKTTSMYVKKAGSYYVTAKFSNGCTVSSTPTLVTVNTKPVLFASFDLSNDTNCFNQKLNITAKNTNGFSDSFSVVSKSGPFSKDSLIKFNFKKGNNIVNVWAKSKNGCVSIPQTKKYFGADTQAAPIVNIINKATNGFRFSWNIIPYATSYLISLDSGKTWSYPTTGKLETFEDVIVSQQGQKKTLMVYALTSKYCGITQIATSVGQGLGCNDVVFNIINSKNRPCKDENYKLVVQGLWNYSKYGLKFNNIPKTDTNIVYNINKNQTFTIDVIDSNNLICGYTSKSINVTVDTGIAPSSNLDNMGTIVVCNSPKTYSLGVTINKVSTGDSLFYVVNNTKSFAGKSANFNINLVKGDSFYLVRKNNNGCSSIGKTIRTDLRKPLNASFATKYITNFQYQFIPTDTLRFHTWNLYDNGNLVDSSKLIKYLADLTVYSQKNLQIKHILSDRTIKSGQVICYASDSANFDVFNYSGIQKINKDLFLFNPNPVVKGENIHFTGNVNFLNSKISLRNINGLLIKSISLDKNNNWIVPINIATGNYIITVENSNKTLNSLIVVQ